MSAYCVIRNKKWSHTCIIYADSVQEAHKKAEGDSRVNDWDDFFETTYYEVELVRDELNVQNEVAVELQPLLDENLNLARTVRALESLVAEQDAKIRTLKNIEQADIEYIKSRFGRDEQ